MIASELDVAWAAGLFEGEGCIRHAREKRGTVRRLTLVSTDADVVQRFCRIVGVGRIRQRRVLDHYKPQWVWEVGRWRDVELVLLLLLPFLGERRRKKALEVLADPATRQGDECPQGHPLMGPNADVYVRKNGRKHCAICVRAQSRAARRARAA